MVNDYSFESYSEMNDYLQFIDYVNKNYEYDEKTITPDSGYKYQGNLFGLFRDMRITPNLFVFTMYLNGFTNPTEYDGVKLNFKIAVKPPIPKG